MTLMTIGETADYLKVAKRTLYKWNSMGMLKPVKLGGVKYLKEEIDKLIEKKRKRY